FYEKEAFVRSIERAKERNQALHIFGLLSDGGVHSHLEHLFALLKLASEHGLSKVYIHAILDGRDVGPKTAKTYLRQTQDTMRELDTGVIATVSGRFYSMDRDNRWERVKKSYDAMVYGEGPAYTDPYEVLEES